jgi:transcriptional regulator with XRE-family HTH domain
LIDRSRVFGYIEQKRILKGDMDVSFGETLRKTREAEGMGLRELARRIGKSQGYLSDVEKDKVAPPSLEVILAIAEALQADKWELLRAADREVDFIASQPEAADFLRKTSDFGPEEWKKAEQLVEIAGLGKKGKEE